MRALLLPYTFYLPAGQAAQAWIQLGVLGPSLFSNELFLQELQGATHLPVVGAGNPRAPQKSGMTFVLITCWLRYNSRRCAPGPVLPSLLPVLWVHILKPSSHMTCFLIFYYLFIYILVLLDLLQDPETPLLPSCLPLGDSMGLLDSWSLRSRTLGA